MKGHTLCRAHRDPELGPRAVGAPAGNLNALKHGRYSHPLPLSQLWSLAGRILAQPGDIVAALDTAVESIQARTGRDPLMTLLALRRVLVHLTTIVAARVFVSELLALLSTLPATTRARARSIIQRQTRHLSPEERVLILRKAKKQLTEQNN